MASGLASGFLNESRLDSITFPLVPSVTLRTNSVLDQGTVALLSTVSNISLCTALLLTVSRASQLWTTTSAFASLARLLRATGFLPITFSSRESFLKAQASKPSAYVVLDLTMPTVPASPGESPGLLPVLDPIAA